MSFLKNLKGLAAEAKDMMGEKKKQEQAHGTSNFGQTGSHQHQSPQLFNQQPPHQQHHQSGLLGQNFGGPPSGPHLPPGWIQQWDQNSQRYVYIEQATGRSQWDPPHLSSGDHNRGFGAPPSMQYPSQSHGYNAGYPQQGGHGKGGMFAAGAGGLALGGLGGAALGHNSYGDDGRHAPGGYGSGYGTDYPGGGYGAPPGSDPRALENNNNVSSSQRSSLEEAREDYEEAQRNAADSDASSSDREELEESREEYREEMEESREEAYGSD